MGRGRYLRKCKRIGELAVMEVARVGLKKTRARAVAMAAAVSSGTVKRRKQGGVGELKLSSTLVQLRSSIRENSVSSRSSERATVSAGCFSSATYDHLTASCCSSNSSSNLRSDSLNDVDLELKEDRVQVGDLTYEFDCKQRRERTPSSGRVVESGDQESTARPSEVDSDRQLKEKMPSESELEEFFAAAENNLQKRFTEKYNYDIVEDVPLEGRYHWVRLEQ